MVKLVRLSYVRVKTVGYSAGAWAVAAVGVAA